MPTRRIANPPQVANLPHKLLVGLVVWVALVAPLFGAEHRGVVKFGGLPLPGASITAMQGEKTVSTISAPDGSYVFLDLADGTWTVQVEMSLFAPVRQDVALSGQPTEWEMKLLSQEEIAKAAAPAASLKIAGTAPVAVAPNGAANTKGATAPNAPTARRAFQRAELNAARTNAPAVSAQPANPEPPVPTESTAAVDSSDLARRAADGFLINGSVNNGAASPFAQFAAFGNNRRGSRSLYTVNLGITFDNSTFDARSFSLTGQDTPKPDYNRFQGLLSAGGPIRIPHLIRNGPMLTINYQWLRNRTAAVQSGLMPTLDQRNGIFSGAIVDPTTNLPFPTNVIPQTRISPQARALLNLYPLPNFQGGTRYNYQIPVVGATHQDNLQSRINKPIGRSNQLAGSLAFQSTHSDNPNIFGFLDTVSSLGLTATANWRHNFTPRLFMNFGMQFSRLASRTTPFFAGHQNISGNADIGGNNQEADNWGPPTLAFASGITALNDAYFNFTRNQTLGYSADVLYSHRNHSFNYGFDYKRQQFSVLSQQDPRGTFTFTGAAAGNDFAGFLLGVPDTSSIAFGNADKYFRGNAWDAYVNDDWRVRNGLTFNVGLRWEYGSPLTEQYGRLVNLNVAPGFSAATPAIGGSLVRPDKNGFAPRVSFAWRPLPASSMVVRGGYGIYYDTSVYLPIASQMAQQSPLSKSIRVQNTAATPLTLANGFVAPLSTTQNTFGIDPDFRTGYSQNWQLSVQRDLPGGMQMTATYLGINGTRAVQQFLPNTFPTGVLNPCPACPSGYTYMTSNGNSTREAGQFQLRRRLRSGFTADASYTYAKAIDDAALAGKTQGNYLIAQDWLNVAGERGRSNFDQRHLVTFQIQYTSGMGIRGGTLLGGWRGTLLKEWTFVSQINAGTGLPLTPVIIRAVPGTGVTSSVRPDYTGASVYDGPSGLFLNPAAYSVPVGHWGNAGRNTITGPAQFTLNASMGRTFRLNDRLNADFRVDATNALNNVTFPSWNTVVGGAQFGLANAANPMRSLQTTFRVRF